MVQRTFLVCFAILGFVAVAAVATPGAMAEEPIAQASEPATVRESTPGDAPVPELLTEQPAATGRTQAESVVESDSAGVCSSPELDTTLEAAEPLERLELDGGCCIPRCFRDKDCDAFCGGKGFGVCAQVNSCCTACLCAG